MRIMPSAANLFAGLALALVALIVSTLIPPLLPEGTDMGYFFILNSVIGFLVGWVTVGRRVGRGLVPGINAGITGAVVLVFWGLFVQSCNEMTRLAMRNRYDSPFEAVTAIFQIGTEYFLLMLTTPIIATLLIGGVITGIVAEGAAQRFR